MLTSSIIKTFRNYASLDKKRAGEVLTRYIEKKIISIVDAKQLACFCGLTLGEIK